MGVRIPPALPNMLGRKLKSGISTRLIIERQWVRIPHCLPVFVLGCAQLGVGNIGVSNNGHVRYPRKESEDTQKKPFRSVVAQSVE